MHEVVSVVGQHENVLVVLFSLHLRLKDVLLPINIGLQVMECRPNGSDGWLNTQTGKTSSRLDFPVEPCCLLQHILFVKSSLSLEEQKGSNKRSWHNYLIFTEGMDYLHLQLLRKPLLVRCLLAMKINTTIALTGLVRVVEHMHRDPLLVSVLLDHTF